MNPEETAKTNHLFIDFETYYDTQVSLKKLTTQQYIQHPKFKVWGVGVRWLSEPEAEWYPEDEVEGFIESVDWEHTAIVCHNAQFDGAVLNSYYGVTPAYYYDTAAMARGREPLLSSSLAAVAERLFPDDPNMRKGKELVLAKGLEFLPPDIEEQIGAYCLKDIELTSAIFKELISGYPYDELDLINLTTRMAVEPSLMLDRELLVSTLAQIKKDTKDIITRSGTTRSVLASNEQFAEHIRKLTGNYPKKISPSTGLVVPALAKDDIKFIKYKENHPELNHIWEAREAVKSRIMETRIQRFLDTAHPDTSRIGTPIRYYAAHTGRFGGSDGLNMQNLPRGSVLRKALSAPDGMLVYVADLSQIEARLLAWISSEDELLNLFAENKDVYSTFASTVYGRPITKKDVEERFVGKTSILGLGYGMGSDKFKATLEKGTMGPPVIISSDQSVNIVTTYRNTYRKIKRFWETCDGFILDMQKGDEGEPISYGPLTILPDKRIQLPNNMYLNYTGLEGTTYKTKTGSTFIYGGKLAENITQALARVVLTSAMLLVDQYLKTINGQVVLQVHDELVCLAPDTNPDSILADIIDILCTPPGWCSSLPLSAEGGYDKVYSK